MGQIQGPAGPEGPKGENGTNGTDGKGWTGGSYNATNGIVTFTSDDGLGFATGDLRGAEGPQGAIGPDGPQGNPGDAATVTAGTTTTGAAGTSASVTNSGTTSAAVFNFTIPRGDKGDPGDKGDTGDTGDAATISVGTTATGAAGSDASVTNSGSSSAAVFDFTIPRGDKGDKGDPGDPGDLSSYATKVYADDGDADTLSNAIAYADGVSAATLSDAKSYADTGDSTTLSSANSYTDSAIAGIPAGLQLDNNQPWTYGQYNALAVPVHSNPGTGSSRFNWNPESLPVVVCADAIAPTTTIFPDAPTVDGMFISITWVSTGSQVWAWDDSVFNSKLGPPEDGGDDVTRVFVSRNGKWTDVA